MSIGEDFFSLRSSQFYGSIEGGNITFSMDRSHVLLNPNLTAAHGKWAVSSTKGHIFTLVDDKNILAMTFSCNARKRAKSILDGGKPVCLYRFVTLDVKLFIKLGRSDSSYE